MVVVYYCGIFEDGQQFDVSYDWGIFFSFFFGFGWVIKGWDEGVVGMKVGGKCKLVIFFDFVYGICGVGGVIFFNVILIFEVELFDVKK